MGAGYVVGVIAGCLWLFGTPVALWFSVRPSRTWNLASNQGRNIAVTAVMFVGLPILMVVGMNSDPAYRAKVAAERVQASPQSKTTESQTQAENDVAPAAAPAAAEEPRARPRLFGGHLTYAKYARIANGMSYEEVVSILGREGSETVSGGIPGYEGKVYQWQNLSGANVIVQFQNDQVITKAQSGL